MGIFFQKSRERLQANLCKLRNDREKVMLVCVEICCLLIFVDGCIYHVCASRLPLVTLQHLRCISLLWQQVASGDSVMSVKLKATLKRIAENLISSGSDVSSQAELSNISSSSIVGVTGVDSALDDHIPHPHISPAVDLRRPDTLYGLVERVVATESL